MKLNLHKLVATDENKLEDGVWYYPLPGIGFKLAYMGLENKQFQKEIIRISGRLKKGKGLDDDKTADLFAEHILKDFDGLEDAEGNIIKYSKETARSIISDKSLSCFVSELIKFAQEYKNFVSEDEESGEELGKDV